MNEKNIRFAATIILMLLAFLIILTKVYFSHQQAYAASKTQISTDKYLIAPGYTDTSKDTTRIDAPIMGTVDKIWVTPGEIVKKGQPLFALDDKNVQAELQIKEMNIKKAKANLALAQVGLKDSSMHYRMAKSVEDSRAVSREELNTLHSQMLKAQANIKLAKAQIAIANAEYDASRTLLKKLTVLSPLNGIILEVNVKIGEFMTNNFLSDPPILLGDPDYIKIRVNIDEQDAWKFNPNSKAFAILDEGGRSTEIPLIFVRTEPYLTTRKLFSNERGEQLFGRVLQVLYKIKRESTLKIYSGQKLDVKIFLSS